MRALSRIVAASLLALGAAGSAGAASFSQLVVFGDSLSDAGNAAAITSANFPPSPLPYAGSFSNGPTAAQYLAQQYGVAVELAWASTGATPSSNNYAVGGARNGSGNYNVEIGNPAGLGVFFPTMASTGIETQIERYAAQHPLGMPDAASTLVMVWGGPNDMFLGAETGGDPSIYIPAALQDLQNDILRLGMPTAFGGLGAQNILVPSMPDLGLTPEALSALDPAISPGLSFLSAAYNDGIDALLAGLGTALSPFGVHLYGFDTPAFLAGITADPAAYGFTNTTDACLYSGAWSPGDTSCAGYLYFDNVHPTTAAHRLLAAGFAQAVPEPATYVLMLSGLLALAAVGARRVRS